MTQEPFTPRVVHPHDIAIQIGTAAGRREMALVMLGAGSAVLCVFAAVGVALLPCNAINAEDGQGNRQPASASVSGRLGQYADKVWSAIRDEKCNRSDTGGEPQNQSENEKRGGEPVPLAAMFAGERKHSDDATNGGKDGKRDFHPALLTSRVAESIR